MYTGGKYVMDMQKKMHKSTAITLHVFFTFVFMRSPYVYCLKIGDQFIYELAIPILKWDIMTTVALNTILAVVE